MTDFDRQKSPAHDLARSRQMLTFEDVDAIGAIVRAVPKDEYVVVVDIGAGSGTTALAALCARPERIRVFSFDVDRAMIHWTKQAVENAGFGAQWRGFEISAQEGARYYESARRRLKREDGWIGVDVLLHDAGHESGDVAGDLRAWAPKLIPGAGIWIHDYVSTYPGVKEDVDRLVDRGLLAAGEAIGMGWSGRFGEAIRETRRDRRIREREEKKNGA